MKTRPILFSAPMVRALLAGAKTQTRRIVKIQPPLGVQTQFASIFCGPDVQSDPRPVFAWRRPGWFDIEMQYCPYGVPGDRLWVRETWYVDDSRVPEVGPLPKTMPDGLGEEQRWFRADGEASEYCEQDDDAANFRWRPSIHMPRWASRLTLEITDVRVERLQAITQDDARAEGCDGSSNSMHSAFTEYFMLWEKINGAGSWAANPWVWALTFKRVTA